MILNCLSAIDTFDLVISLSSAFCSFAGFVGLSLARGGFCLLVLVDGLPVALITRIGTDYFYCVSSV